MYFMLQLKFMAELIYIPLIVIKFSLHVTIDVVVVFSFYGAIIENMNIYARMNSYDLFHQR